MGGNYFEEWDTFTSQERDVGETLRALSSTVLTLLAGGYFIFKLGELLGFPVWLWMHQLLHMALDSPPVRLSLKLPIAITNRLRGHDPSESDVTQPTDMQRNAGSMLGSMFGLGSGGLLKKGVNGLAGALSKSYSNAPPGLGNISNSCYQNSIVQGLASLPTLRKYLLETTTQYHLSESETTTAALFDLINKLNDPKNHGNYFWISGVLKSMSTWQQQDAQEYYSKVLDSLEKEISKATNGKRETAASWLLTAKSLGDLPAPTAEEKGEPTQGAMNLDGASDSTTPNELPQIPSNPLNGLQAQRVGCVVCGYTEGLSMIPFTNLTVPLGKRWAYDIRECLDEVTNLELIEGVECAKCTLLKRKEDLSVVLGKPNINDDIHKSVMERLQIVQDALDDEDFEDATLIKKCMIPKKNWVKSTKSRQAVIARAPKSLVLHVNRSVFDEYTGAQFKNMAQVHFPKLLDLGLWCLGSHPATDSQSPDESIEEWPRNPQVSMLRGIVDDVLPSSPFQYDLRAVVTHYGRHENGHYIAYRRHPSAKPKPVEASDEVDHTESVPDADEDQPTQSEQWWRFSDDDVSAVSEDVVLNQGGVFMLFYERIDAVPETPLPSVNILAVPASAPPLPPMDIGLLDSQMMVHVSEAVQVPLPDDESDGEALPSPPLSPALASQAANVLVPEPLQENLQTVESAVVEPTISAYPTPPPIYNVSNPGSYASETDTAGYESEDAPSTQLTSDDEQEPSGSEKQSTGQIDLGTSHAASSPPHMMRAGDTPRGGTGSRASLPMVTAGY